MKLLLDTCVLLWMMTGDKTLKTEHKSQLVSADNEVYVSVVSLWEILVKQQLGKLKLPEPVSSYLTEQIAAHELELIDLDAKSVLLLPKLPNHHQDPFDRMLICQAIENGFDLFTPDSLVAQYPVKVFW